MLPVSATGCLCRGAVRPRPSVYILLAMWLIPTVLVEASIVIPGWADFQLDATQISAAPAQDSDSSGAIPEKEVDGRRDSLLAPVNVDAAIPSQSPVGSGSSSSSSNLLGGSTLMAMNANVQLAESEISGWVVGQRSLSIPMPPVTGLLRPPQNIVLLGG